MGEVLWGIDFRNKKRQDPETTPLETGLGTIAHLCLPYLDCPPEILATLYESSLGFMPIMPTHTTYWGDPDYPGYIAPEKDPA